LETHLALHDEMRWPQNMVLAQVDSILHCGLLGRKTHHRQ